MTSPTATSASTRKSPKYVKLARKLAEEIELGILKPGDRLPSFGEIYEQFGAATNTADRAFQLLEQQGLVRREQGRGIFVAEPREPAPQQKTGLVGFVGGFGPNSDFRSKPTLFSLQIIEGIQEVLSSVERQVVLLDGDTTHGLEKIDGLFICSTGQVEPILRQLPPHIPCVSLLVEIEGVPSVVTDDCQAARNAVEYLIGLGHRRIACLMEFPYTLPRLRMEGYLEAMQEAGIAVNPRWLHQPLNLRRHSDSYREWGREAMSKWLREGWHELGCTAVLAQNDLVAAGIQEALQGAGVCVPRDVSVMGFDGTEIGEYCSPQLTSVKLPLQQLGAAAAQNLLKMMNRDVLDEAINAEEPPLIQVLPSKLCIRQSTAPAV